MRHTAPQRPAVPHSISLAMAPEPRRRLRGFAATACAALGLGATLLLGGGLAQPAVAADNHGVKHCKAVHATNGQTLTVRVTGLRSTQGNVAIVLYGSNPASFLARGGRLTRRRVPAATSAETCFELPSAGLYAVAVYHHEDASHTTDRDGQIVAGEGHGYSNNPPAGAAKPGFEQSRFEVRPGSNSITINVQY